MQGSEHGCGKPLPGAFNGQEVAAAGVMDAHHFLADKGDADGLFLGGFGKGVIQGDAVLALEKAEMTLSPEVMVGSVCVVELTVGQEPEFGAVAVAAVVEGDGHFLRMNDGGSPFAKASEDK